MRRAGVFIVMALLALVLAWWGTRVETGADVEMPVISVPAPTVTPRTRPEGLVRAPAVDTDAPPASTSTPRATPTFVPSAGPSEPMEEGVGILEVVVVDDAGMPIEDRVGVRTTGDCGDRRFVVTDGGGETEVPVGRCEIVGWRRDGALPTRTNVAMVDVRPGERALATLRVPSERTGGLGVRIARHPRGVLVEAVVPGSPAAEAGLEPGDVIVEVDGAPASSLTLEEFQDVMTGPVGSTVDFVLSYDGPNGTVEEPIVVTRAFLEG